MTRAMNTPMNTGMTCAVPMNTRLTAVTIPSRSQAPTPPRTSQPGRESRVADRVVTSPTTLTRAASSGAGAARRSSETIGASRRMTRALSASRHWSARSIWRCSACLARKIGLIGRCSPAPRGESAGPSDGAGASAGASTPAGTAFSAGLPAPAGSSFALIGASCPAPAGPPGRGWDRSGSMSGLSLGDAAPQAY